MSFQDCFCFLGSPKAKPDRSADSAVHAWATIVLKIFQDFMSCGCNHTKGPLLHHPKQTPDFPVTFVCITLRNVPLNRDCLEVLWREVSQHSYLQPNTDPYPAAQQVAEKFQPELVLLLLMMMMLVLMMSLLLSEELGYVQEMVLISGINSLISSFGEYSRALPRCSCCFFPSAAQQCGLVPEGAAVGPSSPPHPQVLLCLQRRAQQGPFPLHCAVFPADTWQAGAPHGNKGQQ